MNATTPVICNACLGVGRVANTVEDRRCLWLVCPDCDQPAVTYEFLAREIRQTNEGPVEAYLDCTDGFIFRAGGLPENDYNPEPLPYWPFVVLPLVVAVLLGKWLGL